MFQFPAFAPSLMVTWLHHAGLPHSEITVSKPVCSYTVLIAAYHVLLRLQKPRHPPFALVTFSPYRFLDTLFMNHKNSCLHLSFVFSLPYEIVVHNSWTDSSQSLDSLVVIDFSNFDFYLVISLNIVKELLSSFLLSGCRVGLFRQSVITSR